MSKVGTSANPNVCLISSFHNDTDVYKLLQGDKSRCFFGEERSSMTLSLCGGGLEEECLCIPLLANTAQGRKDLV